ncbi:MAG TPA: ABC transporter permease [Thermomicrobiales bacterium]|nr:ABC transporter permease [Thermomicrobiales bacterium]
MQSEFIRLVKAELFMLRKRPGTWVILGLWAVETLVFGYIFPYVAYQNGSGEFYEGLDVMLPVNMVAAVGEGMPFFGGALALILGVLTVGGEFGWGTWKTVLTQGPSRTAVFAAKMTALMLAMLPFVLVGYGLGAVASSTVAIVEDATMTWPGVRTMVEAVLSGWLVLAVWAATGALLATWTRGTSLAIGLGIIWGLALEGLISAFANSISWLEWLVDLLLRSNGYSLIQAVSGEVENIGGNNGPGSFSGPYVSGTQATIVLLLYLAVFLGGSLILMRKRDVA